MRKKFLVSDPFFSKAIIQKMLFIYASTSCQNYFVICMIYLVLLLYQADSPEETLFLYDSYIVYVGTKKIIDS